MSEANPELKTFFALLEEEKSPDIKVLKLVDFMESALAQPGSPQFKHFWEARKKALELFKDVSNPQVRNQLWTRYSELSKEARRLKDLLDEESAFNVEQIDLAIQALENECSKFQEEVPSLPVIDFSSYSHFIKPEISYFEPKQRELNLLNAYASRVNALRKELIKLEMRIRQKNKFFQRLSQVGDLIFPRRKELINDVSLKFSDLIQKFKGHYFSKEINESHFFLRDEIKGLQGAAKLFTLSAQAFKETRLALSECWDILKAEEKDLKKHRQEQKEVYKTNCHELTESLKEIESQFQSGDLDTHKVEHALSDFSREMREKELGRDEVRFLKEELSRVKELVFAEAKKEEALRLKEAEKKEEERKQLVSDFQEKISQFLEEAKSLEIEAVEGKKLEILSEIEALSTPKRDKLELEKALRPLKDILVEKKEALLLDLPENDRQALAQLQELLKERKVRKTEQKSLVDSLKTQAGGSGLDMVKGLELSARLSDEKEKLDQMNHGIQDLEKKIAAYKNI